MALEELSLQEAWDMLEADSDAVLVDVRTQAEWNFVGTPDLSSLGRDVGLIEWSSFPGGQRNESFVNQVAASVGAEQPVLLLCRSGARSAAAADALTQAGYGRAYNVVAGFEGDLDADGHRHGGWKDALPWKQG